MEILFGLVIVLVLITLIGHGIWAALAWLVRVGEPKRPVSSKFDRTHCPRCESRLTGGACEVCHWPVANYDRNPRPAALREVRRQLASFADLGLIDQATFHKLDGEFVAQMERKRSHPAAAPTPSVTATEASKVLSEPPESTTDLPTLEEIEAVSPVAPAVHPTPSPAERARQFAARKNQPVEPVPPTPARPPRRPWTDLLAAFMEEKNIRWGELVGGLLIVCCSIALVISFWAKIAERPFLKFFVFNGVTAALFGLGLYSEKRWKLRTTSEGLLITASLLVPLNFLSIAAFTQGAQAGGFWTIAGELVSIALFAALLFSAGSILMPGQAGLLTAGTLAPSILMLLSRRFVGTENDSFAAEFIAWTTLAGHAVTNGLGARTLFPRNNANVTHRAPFVFKLLSITAFATTLALGLLVYRMGDLAEAFHRLAPLVCATGFVPLAIGLAVWRQCDQLTEAAHRTAGLSIAVGGVMLLLAGVVLAWPEPRLLLFTAALAGATLLAVAIVFRLPQAHFAAVLCLTLGYLVGWHSIRGHLSWRTNDAQQSLGVLVSGESGQALLPLVALLVGVAWSLRRGKYAQDARFLSFSAAGMAALSLALITWFGFGIATDPLNATVIYAVYAVATYLFAERFKSLGALCASAALTFAAVAQGVVFNFAAKHFLALPWATALVLDAGIMAAAAALILKLGGALRRDEFAPALLAGAKCVSFTAAGLMIATIWASTPASILAPRWLGLAVVWLAIAWLNSSAIWFSVFQVGLAIAVWFGVAMRLELRDWFHDAPRPWLDPWTLTSEGIALGLLCAVGFLARWTVKFLADRKPVYSAALGKTQSLFNASWPSVDAVLLRVLLAACTAVAIYAALPGVAQELSPRGAHQIPPLETFEIAGISHDHARGVGIWLWIAVLAIASTSEVVVRKRRANCLALFLLASLACPLLASGWQDERATASALRWLAAGFLLLASSVIWCRDWFARMAQRWNLSYTGTFYYTKETIAASFALSLLPLFVMALYVGIAAAMRHPPDAEIRSWFLPLGILFVVAAAIAMSLRTAVTFQQTSRNKTSNSATLAGHLSSLLLILGLAPLLSVTLFVVAAALKHSPIWGPDPGSWFARAGLATSYAVPVLVTALTLVGYAIRERSARFAFVGGLVLNLGITAAYLLTVAKTGLRFDTTQWIRLAQLNAMTSATFALAWIASLVPRLRLGTRSELLVTQVCIPVALNLLVLVPTWITIWWNPSLALELASVGDLWGWSAAALAILSVLALQATSRTMVTAREFAVMVFALGTVTAAFVGSRTGTSWTAFRTLLIFHVSVIGLLAVGSWLLERWRGPSLGQRRETSRSALVASIFAVILALRAIFDDPQAPWWTATVLGLVAVLVAWFAGWSLRRGLLHYAAALICLAALSWWAYKGSSLVGSSSLLFGFPQVFVISLALPTIAWVFIELRIFQPAVDRVTTTGLPPMQRLAVRFSLAVFTLMLAASLLADLYGEFDTISITGQWLALTTILVAAMALLWDVEARDTVALLYLTGLFAAGTLLDTLDLNEHWMLWLGTITLAAYALVTSFLWSRRAGLRAIGDLLHVPRGAEKPFAHLGWLVPLNCLLVTAVVVLTFAIELTYAEFNLRSLAANAVIAAAVSIGLLARGERRSQLQLQFAALALGALAAIALAWAPLDPETSGGLLNRSVAVAAALGVATVIYGIGFGKLLPSSSEWLAAAQRIVLVLLVGAAATLLFVLGTEITLFATTGGVVMASPAIGIVAVTLIGLSIASLAAAMLPGRDPLGLSERGRQAYVYAAEVLLGLGFVHIRLTMPWLFHGFFMRYWPIIIMVIAFIGAGVGEWLRRRKLTVLGDPLENTGAMLPLLPVIAFWVVPTQVDYSLLLLAVGLLYAGLSVARKSFGFGVLAVISANGGLWYFLNRWEGYRLLDHPQLWLIPPALCVLAAAQINRKQLTDAQMTAIRYACAVMVYVSSTADIFLNGVAQAPWLPVVLAGISLLGIFAGILLRIRAFLFLGIAFLILALVTIIWHAAVDLNQTWLWYASGIVTGAVIIAVFAVFEKKRDEILQIVEKLKHWES